MPKSFTIEDGMLLKEITAQLKPHELRNKVSYNKVSAFIVKGEYTIFLPKVLRTKAAELDKRTLGAMELRRSEDDNTLFFLGESTRHDDLDGFN